MDAKELALFLAEALSEKKAEDIVILEVEDLLSYASYFVVATGRSQRQVAALVDHVAMRARGELKRRPLGSEGVDVGNWALLDFGDVVVHVFRPEERHVYDLESLWEDAPRVPVPLHTPEPAIAAAR
jgi:ribosome-associated protein